MKTILFSACAGILLFSSCENILQLEPAQSISNEAALDTPEGVQQALSGAYDNFSVSSMCGGEMIRNADLYGGEGELLWVGTYTAPKEVFQRDIFATNLDVDQFWDASYATINACNAVLGALDVIENESDKERTEGEAKCLRAWCYFELTRYFGQQYEPGGTNTQLAVPIVLTATSGFDESSLVSRNTVEECYAQIISDLNEAEALLPEKNDFYLDKHCAQALLARVYLQQEDYTNAGNAADRLISSNDYSLLPLYADCFNQDDKTDEDIFSLEISEQDGSNSLNTYYATNTNGGRGDIEILDEHLALYVDGDTRKDLFYDQAGSTFTGKYNNEYGNIQVIRLAEMYLIRAECNQRLGTSTGDTPLNDYNAVHTRAGLTAALSVSLEDILLERRVELAFEGFKIWDIKRLHEIIGTMNYNDPKLIYPIPQAEIDVNPNLIQNPTY